MFNKNNDRKEAARNGLQSGIAIFANMIAIAVTFFGTGPLFSATLPFVREFTESYYSVELLPIIDIFWFVIVAGSIFGISRTTIYTSLMSLAVVAAARLI